MATSCAVTVKIEARLLPLTGMDQYGAPAVADEDLDLWGQWYEDSGTLDLFGIRFLAFMQDPVVLSNGLAGLAPEIVTPPRDLGRRLTRTERFQVARVIHAERQSAR